MKKQKRITIILLTGLFCSFVLYAKQIPTKGKWDDRGYRTFCSAPPEANINGNIVSIYSPDLLSNLDIVISDNKGNVIYQQTLSFESGEVIYLPVMFKEGDYIIRISRFWRYLIGEFEVFF